MVTQLEQAALDYATSQGWAPGTLPAVVVDCLAGTAPSTLPTIISPQPIAYYNSRCTSLARELEDVKDGTVLVFGDSNIEGGWVHDLLMRDNAINLGISGDTWRGLLNRLNTGGAGNKIHKAGAVVVLMGLNDIAQEGVNYVGNLAYMFDLLVPWMSGNWVICKILPVREGTTAAAGVTNAKIDTINNILEQKFSAKAKIVDVKSSLMVNGEVPVVHTADGVHLTHLGKSILFTGIRAKLVELGV